VPKRFIKIWTSALKRFCSIWPHFVGTLILQIIQQISENVTLIADKGDDKELTYKISLLYCWMTHVLVKRKKWVQNYNSIEFPFKSIAELCIQNYHSKWCKLILEKFSSDQPIEIVSQLRVLGQFNEAAFNLSHKNFLTKSQVEGTNLLDLEQLQQKVIQQQQPGNNEIIEEAIIDSGDWTKSNLEWKNCPIGLLSDGSFPDLELPVELEGFQFVLKRIETKQRTDITQEGQLIMTQENNESEIQRKRKVEDNQIEPNKSPKFQVKLLMSLKDLENVAFVSRSSDKEEIES